MSESVLLGSFSASSRYAGQRLVYWDGRIYIEEHGVVEMDQLAEVFADPDLAWTNSETFEWSSRYLAATSNRTAPRQSKRRTRRPARRRWVLAMVLASVLLVASAITWGVASRDQQVPAETATQAEVDADRVYHMKQIDVIERMTADAAQSMKVAAKVLGRDSSDLYGRTQADVVSSRRAVERLEALEAPPWHRDSHERLALTFRDASVALRDLAEYAYRVDRAGYDEAEMRFEIESQHMIDLVDVQADEDRARGIDPDQMKVDRSVLEVGNSQEGDDVGGEPIRVTVQSPAIGDAWLVYPAGQEYWKSYGDDYVDRLVEYYDEYYIGGSPPSKTEKRRQQLQRVPARDGAQRVPCLVKVKTPWGFDYAVVGPVQAIPSKDSFGLGKDMDFVLIGKVLVDRRFVVQEKKQAEALAKAFERSRELRGDDAIDY